MTWTRTGLELYVDGNIVASKSDISPGKDWVTSGNFVRFGKPTDELSEENIQSFHGWLDEYALWDRPLTSEEVMLQFKAAFGKNAD